METERQSFKQARQVGRDFHNWTVRVDQAEYTLFMKAHALNLTPKFVVSSRVQNTNTILLTMQRYPQTFKQLTRGEQFTMLPFVKSAITKLHKEALILHCDLHPNNIVVDFSRRDVRIIDFEDACEFKDFEKAYQTTDLLEAQNIEMNEFCKKLYLAPSIRKARNQHAVSLEKTRCCKYLSFVMLLFATCFLLSLASVANK
jgi:serine/threonine protein kinase